MSLSKPIPKKMRDEMAEDSFMKSCCLQGFDSCSGRIEWHHNLIYASNRVNEKFCILPLCSEHHKKESRYKKILNRIMVWRATYDECRRYSKAVDYVGLKTHVDEYGV